MKVGIIGYRGFVGSAFFKVFSQGKGHEAVGIGKENYGSIAGQRFDLLINANGNSSKPLADKDPALDFEMNVSSTLRFLQELSFSHYLHLSSVEVYNDKSSRKGTSEEAQIDPFSLSNYGFSKYMGEIVARRCAKSWMILRLAGMVGENARKGPAYDMATLRKLFLSEKSRLHFLNTEKVALMAKKLLEMEKFGQVYNLAGRKNVELGAAAASAGIKLSSAGKEEVVLEISTSKLEKLMEVPDSSDELTEYLLAEKKKRE
jgi:nucleoside-diphosphate-sugar epimerase